MSMLLAYDILKLHQESETVQLGLSTDSKWLAFIYYYVCHDK